MQHRSNSPTRPLASGRPSYLAKAVVALPLAGRAHTQRERRQETISERESGMACLEAYLDEYPEAYLEAYYQ